MAQQSMSSDITSDDKLWSALGYPIFPIAIVMLLMEDKKKRPFIKFHAVQALAINVVVWVVGVILGFLVVGVCADPIMWLLLIWPAVLAYQGKMFDIPVIGKFIRGQHWVA
jgi:uncharacterized membrane protein